MVAGTGWGAGRKWVRSLETFATGTNGDDVGL